MQALTKEAGVITPEQQAEYDRLARWEYDRLWAIKRKNEAQDAAKAAKKRSADVEP